jgi:serine/threonine protein kinase
MATGNAAFSGLNSIQLKHNILYCKPFLSNNICPHLVDLIVRLLQKNPLKRITSTNEIKNHPFFTGVNFYNLKAPFKPQLKSECDTRYFSDALRRIEPFAC